MKFSEVLGQDKIKEHLRQEIHNNRVSHSQMFLGPSGTNKLSLAIAFSQMILCENPTESDSCGTCRSCKQVASYSHPDLHFAYPSLQAERKKSGKGSQMDKEWIDQLKENPEFTFEQWNNRISPKGTLTMLGNYESQEIPKKLSLKSFAGGYKIMIIWMQEKMNQTCANKLLKLLEEPPSKTLIILISENTELTLPTIISRTQILNIPKLTDQVLESYILTKITNPEEVKAIVKRSNGSIIEAGEIIDGSEKKLQFLEHFITLMRSCYTKDVSVMLDWAEDASKIGREGLNEFFKYSLYMTRESLIRNYQNDLSAPSPEESSFLQKFARFINGNNVLTIYEELNKASYFIQRNCNPKIILTGLTFQIMRELHKA